MEIKIDGLKKTFGNKIAVDVEHFNIASGEMLGLVGNNGAGKTTLFRLLLDLTKADSGSVMLGDINPNTSEKWKNKTGAYIDEGFLIDFLIPEEYFQFIAQINGISRDTLNKQMETFARFMSGEVIGQKKLIRTLSAGNKQKVGIIAALINEPDLLILDEPFNFLDPTSQYVLKNLLKTYSEEHHATILISSHNLSHTVDICNRIALMEHGKIIDDLTNKHGEASEKLEHYFNASSENEMDATNSCDI